MKIEWYWYQLRVEKCLGGRKTQKLVIFNKATEKGNDKGPCLQLLIFSYRSNLAKSKRN